VIIIKELVTASHVGLVYQSEEGELTALSDVSFSVAPGEFLSIIGPSGCGKSTLLTLIAGLMPVSRGEVLIDGRPPKEASDLIGYMLQKDTLFPWRTIWQNVTLGLELRRIRTPERLAYTEELLRTYGLYEFRNSRPDDLSGGMRQRCALIRTLATGPSLLLLDEAFSALDYQTRLAVADDIYGIIRREKKTAIIVTHDISEAVSLSDRVLVLSKRPATVKSVHEIHFAKEGLSPLERRDEPEFREYFQEIWRDIDVHIS